MTNISTQDITEDVKYLIHPDHRNGTQDKSQWTISTDDEINTFKLSLSNSWLIDQNGWGLFLDGDQTSVLGLSSDRQRSLFIAKFIDSTNKQEWHGYPADHVRRNSDIPVDTVLKEWMSRGYLKPSKVSKIIRGKPCNL